MYQQNHLKIGKLGKDNLDLGMRIAEIELRDGA
jgi:hypothetical protein